MDDTKTQPEDFWKKKLTDEEYHVCREGGTEAPFSGRWVDNHETGMYHCVACGQPLFSSDTKFESGTGWPSFYKAVESGDLEYVEDKSHDMMRTEVRCGNCGAHLGHVFNDGPQPTGKRYCINSVALNFQPTDDNLKEKNLS